MHNGHQTFDSSSDEVERKTEHITATASNQSVRIHSSFPEGEDALMPIVKENFEKALGPITQIEKVPNARNFVYRITYNDKVYIYKGYNTKSRGSFDTEVWVYSQLPSSRYTKKIIREYVGAPHNYIITNYQEGNILSNLMKELKDEVTANYIALQIVTFIKSCSQIDTQRYGRFSQNGSGSEDTWSQMLLKYLDNLIARASALDCRAYLIENLSALSVYFKQVHERLNYKKPVLTPVDLNLDNFIISKQHGITFIDLESFWSADILIAVGDFIGNTYDTLLGSAFIDQWGELSPEDTELVHAYALLSNLSALIYIAEHGQDISESRPRGNPNTYLTLIEVHKKKITHNSLSSSSNIIQHFSARNSSAFYKPNFLGKEALHSRVSEITQIIRRFCNVEFKRTSEKFYVLIYGSYAYGMAQASSDLDIVFVAENDNSVRRERIIHFIISLHEKYGLRKDNEVPYEKKALISMNFIKRACAGEGIRHNKQWEFPSIVKDKAYLASDELLLRFLQGMLANPNLYIDGHHDLYLTHRKCATFNLIKAIMFEHQITQTSAIGLLEKFCIDKQGNTGDFYLGFSYREPFKAYLSEHLEAVLSSIKPPTEIGPRGAEYHFTAQEIARRSHVRDFTNSSYTEHTQPECLSVRRNSI